MALRSELLLVVAHVVRCSYFNVLSKFVDLNGTLFERYLFYVVTTCCVKYSFSCLDIRLALNSNWKMGESNTPPVSPRDPTMDEESDDEIPAEGDAFEVYELDDEEFEEEIEDEEGQEMVEEEIDVPDDSVCVFKKHEGK